METIKCLSLVFGDFFSDSFHPSRAWEVLYSHVKHVFKRSVKKEEKNEIFAGDALPTVQEMLTTSLINFHGRLSSNERKTRRFCIETLKRYKTLSVVVQTLGKRDPSLARYIATPIKRRIVCREYEEPEGSSTYEYRGGT